MAASQLKGQFINHSNGQTTYVIEDDFTDPWKPSETILIQHGFGRHSGFWYHWVPFLSRNYRIIRRDARGHGRSSVPRPEENYDYSTDTICEEIIDTINQLNINKVHFLGESTSGIVGEILAAKYPNRIASLIICSSPTYLPKPALDMFAFGEPSWAEACIRLGSRGWGLALSKIPGTVPISDREYLQWWLDQMSLSSGEGLAGYSKYLSMLDSRPYLSQIKVPMLILAPANSAATKLEEQMWIQRQVAGAKLEVIHGKSHEIYVEKPTECQNAVKQFIDSLQI